MMAITTSSSIKVNPRFAVCGRMLKTGMTDLINLEKKQKLSDERIATITNEQ
jgi:hypothetical protein